VLKYQKIYLLLASAPQAIFRLANHKFTGNVAPFDKKEGQLFSFLLFRFGISF